MKVAIIYNKDRTGVLNVFGMQNKEVYNPKTVRKVETALEEGGHNVEIIDGNMRVIEQLQSFMPKVIEGEHTGMVFNMAYGIQGESRYTHIPSMLEMLGIPYVGSSPSGHAMALDKIITKIILQKHNLPTPEFWVFSNPDDDMQEVVYPVIVKPKMESVSFGLRVVNTEKELKEAVEFIISEFQQQALVERFIRGREFAVGLIGNNPVEAFPVLEIDLENDPDAIQTVEDKRKTPRGKTCPADLPSRLGDRMKKISVDAFKALQLRDFSRVDIRMDKEENVYILEINSMASLGGTGSYVHAAGIAGYNYNSLVNKMLDVAAVRYFANRLESFQNMPVQKKTIPAPVRMRGFLRSRQEGIEALLKKLVNINTYVRNVDGVNETGNLIKKELSLMGFSCETIPQVEVGNILFFTNSNDNSYDILLLGELDNNTRIAEQEYYSVSAQKLTGTGIWEHKAGIVTAVAAIQSLRFIRLLRKIKIGVLLTTDSSLQGRSARSYIKEKAVNAGYVLGLHGGDISGSLITSRSGSAVYRFNMHLQKTDDANMVAVAASTFTRLVNGWCELSVDDSSLVIAPYSTSLSTNILQPYAHGEVLLSVRFNEMDQYQEVDRKIRKLIPYRKYANRILFQIEGGLRRPPMNETQAIQAFWQKVKNIASSLDILVAPEHRWSSADICYIEAEKEMLDGFGPVGQKEQEKSEFIFRHSLLERATLLGMVIKEISGN